MLTPVLVVVMAIALWVWVRPRPSDRVDVVMLALLFIVTVGGAVFMSIVVALGVGSLLPEKIDANPSRVAELVALRSADGISGQLRGGFFLAHGVIGSEAYYFWYERHGSDGYTPRQMAVGVGTYVYERDDVKPTLKVYDWHFKQSWWRWFAIDSDEGKTYEFYIPVGSIKKGYALQ